jgi:general stress protein 26
MIVQIRKKIYDLLATLDFTLSNLLENQSFYLLFGLLFNSFLIYNYIKRTKEKFMEKQKFVKFRHNDHKGIFHYDVYNGDIVVLSKNNTSKIDYIKSHGAIDVTFIVEEEDYQVMGVDIINDPSYVQEVYDHFKNSENDYFKDGIDGLCVLKFHK